MAKGKKGRVIKSNAKPNTISSSNKSNTSSKLNDESIIDKSSSNELNSNLTNTNNNISDISTNINDNIEIESPTPLRRSNRKRNSNVPSDSESKRRKSVIDKVGQNDLSTETDVNDNETKSKNIDDQNQKIENNSNGSSPVFECLKNASKPTKRKIASLTPSPKESTGWRQSIIGSKSNSPKTHNETVPLISTVIDSNRIRAETNSVQQDCTGGNDVKSVDFSSSKDGTVSVDPLSTTNKSEHTTSSVPSPILKQDNVVASQQVPEPTQNNVATAAEVPRPTTVTQSSKRKSKAVSRSKRTQSPVPKPAIVSSTKTTSSPIPNRENTNVVAKQSSISNIVVGETSQNTSIPSPTPEIRPVTPQTKLLPSQSPPVISEITGALSTCKPVTLIGSIISKHRSSEVFGDSGSESHAQTSDSEDNDSELENNPSKYSQVFSTKSDSEESYSPDDEFETVRRKEKKITTVTTKEEFMEEEDQEEEEEHSQTNPMIMFSNHITIYDGLVGDIPAADAAQHLNRQYREILEDPRVGDTTFKNWRVRIVQEGDRVVVKFLDLTGKSRHGIDMIKSSLGLVSYATAKHLSYCDIQPFFCEPQGKEMSASLGLNGQYMIKSLLEDTRRMLTICNIGTQVKFHPTLNNFLIPIGFESYRRFAYAEFRNFKVNFSCCEFQTSTSLSSTGTILYDVTVWRGYKQRQEKLAHYQDESLVTIWRKIFETIEFRLNKVIHMYDSLIAQAVRPSTTESTDSMPRQVRTLSFPSQDIINHMATEDVDTHVCVPPPIPPPFSPRSRKLDRYFAYDQTLCEFLRSLPTPRCPEGYRFIHMTVREVAELEVGEFADMPYKYAITGYGNARSWFRTLPDMLCLADMLVGYKLPTSRYWVQVRTDNQVAEMAKVLSKGEVELIVLRRTQESSGSNDTARVENALRACLRCLGMDRSAETLTSENDIETFVMFLSGLSESRVQKVCEITDSIEPFMEAHGYTLIYNRDIAIRKLLEDMTDGFQLCLDEMMKIANTLIIGSRIDKRYLKESNTLMRLEDLQHVKTRNVKNKMEAAPSWLPECFTLPRDQLSKELFLSIAKVAGILRSHRAKKLQSAVKDVPFSIQLLHDACHTSESTVESILDVVIGVVEMQDWPHNPKNRLRKLLQKYGPDVSSIQPYMQGQSETALRLAIVRLFTEDMLQGVGSTTEASPIPSVASGKKSEKIIGKVLQGIIRQVQNRQREYEASTRLGHHYHKRVLRERHAYRKRKDTSFGPDEMATLCAAVKEYGQTWSQLLVNVGSSLWGHLDMSVKILAAAWGEINDVVHVEGFGNTLYALEGYYVRFTGPAITKRLSTDSRYQHIPFQNTSRYLFLGMGCGDLVSGWLVGKVFLEHKFIRGESFWAIGDETGYFACCRGDEKDQNQHWRVITNSGSWVPENDLKLTMLKSGEEDNSNETIEAIKKIIVQRGELERQQAQIESTLSQQMLHALRSELESSQSTTLPKTSILTIQ